MLCTVIDLGMLHIESKNNVVIVYYFSHQRFSGIPVTGDIDEATMKLMKLPRCGLPDKVDPRFTRVRHKRYTIHGQQWLHRNLTWR